jgi:hypothetical protein
MLFDDYAHHYKTISWLPTRFMTCRNIPTLAELRRLVQVSQLVTHRGIVSLSFFTPGSRKMIVPMQTSGPGMLRRLLKCPISSTSFPFLRSPETSSLVTRTASPSVKLPPPFLEVVTLFPSLLDLCSILLRALNLHLLLATMCPSPVPSPLSCFPKTK